MDTVRWNNLKAVRPSHLIGRPVPQRAGYFGAVWWFQRIPGWGLGSSFPSHARRPPSPLFPDPGMLAPISSAGQLSLSLSLPFDSPGNPLSGLDLDPWRRRRRSASSLLWRSRRNNFCLDRFNWGTNGVAFWRLVGLADYRLLLFPLILIVFLWLGQND